MDEIDNRLRETADRCIKAYDKWNVSKKDSASREELMEAVHELRKVASRVEVEVAISERDEMAQRPLPIPPHRAARGGRGVSSDMPVQGDDEGTEVPVAETQQPKRRPQFRGPRQSAPAAPSDDDANGNN